MWASLIWYPVHQIYFTSSLQIPRRHTPACPVSGWQHGQLDTTVQVLWGGEESDSHQRRPTTQGSGGGWIRNPTAIRDGRKCQRPLCSGGCGNLLRMGCRWLCAFLHSYIMRITLSAIWVLMNIMLCVAEKRNIPLKIMTQSVYFN